MRYKLQYVLEQLKVARHYGIHSCPMTVPTSHTNDITLRTAKGRAQGSKFKNSHARRKGGGSTRTHTSMI